MKVRTITIGVSLHPPEQGQLIAHAHDRLRQASTLGNDIKQKLVERGYEVRY